MAMKLNEFKNMTGKETNPINRNVKLIVNHRECRPEDKLLEQPPKAHLLESQPKAQLLEQWPKAKLLWWTAQK